MADFLPTSLLYISILAAEKGSRVLVATLISEGADVNEKNESQQTPLHYAASSNAGDAAQALLAHGADVDARSESQRTPLHTAAYYNAVDAAKVLLAHGADVNARDEDEDTPLDDAERKGHDEMETLLCQHVRTRGGNR